MREIDRRQFLTGAASAAITGLIASKAIPMAGAEEALGDKYANIVTLGDFEADPHYVQGNQWGVITHEPNTLSLPNDYLRVGDYFCEGRGVLTKRVMTDA